MRFARYHGLLAAVAVLAVVSAPALAASPTAEHPVKVVKAKTAPAQQEATPETAVPSAEASPETTPAPVAAAPEHPAKAEKPAAKNEAAHEQKKQTEAPAAAPAPVAKPASKLVLPTTEDITAGDLTIKSPKIVYKSGDLNLYFSIKNAGKIEEKLVSAETTWAAKKLVLVTRNNEGKEIESDPALVFAADKTTDFDSGEKWLRLKDADKPDVADLVQITLSFRRSPNVVLNMATDPAKASKAIEELAAKQGQQLPKKKSFSLWDWFRH